MDFHDWLIAHSFDRVLTKDAKIIILTNPQDGYWFYDRATRVTHRVSEPALKTIATPQHPYTRPVEPLIRILRHYQIAGPLCDPYCGSGSIMVAAHALGIQSVAIDIVPAYAVAAASRISVQP
jgi:DNA modification methylase